MSRRLTDPRIYNSTPITDAIIGQASGIASLNELGIVPESQLPDFLTEAEGNVSYILKTDTIRQPTAISPTTGTIDYGVDGTLTANSYGHLYDTTRLHREYQIDILAGDFSVPIRSVEINSDEWVITPPIPDNTEFQWRCRDVSTESEVGL